MNAEHILVTLVNVVVPNPVQSVPFIEYASELVPEPPATQYPLFQHIEVPASVKILFPRPVQFIPSVDVAIVFTPGPTAIHNEPFHATSLHPDGNTR